MSEENPIADRGVLPDEMPVGVTLNRECPGCGAVYQWTSRPGYQWPTVYCSRKCKRKSAGARLVKFDGEVPESADEMRLLVCAYCEEPFGWVPRREADGTLTPPSYCSLNHGTAFRLKRRKARRAAESAARKTLRAEEVRRRAEVEERDARIAAESEAARFLLLPAGRCATCGKVANPTTEAAKDAKRAIEKRAGRTNAVRYYQCEDGWWHWTRMDATLDGFRARNAEHLMTESPASLRHRGRGGWTVPR